MMLASRRGLTLLEVMVALVVLTLVGLSYLELFDQGHRVATRTRRWTDAITYAQDAMETAKLGGVLPTEAPERLPGGFRRRITRRPWQGGYTLVTVTVFLPDGSRFDLDRLTRPRPVSDADSTQSAEEW